MTDKELEKLLSKFRNKLKPRKELVQKILADLEIGEDKKGRLSTYELIFNQIHNLMTKWKVLIPVTIVVLAIIVWGFIQFSHIAPITNPEIGRPAGEEQAGKQTEEQTEQYTEKEYVKTPPEVSVPQAGGNIEDTIDALTALSENEMVIITEESNDASLIDLDNQAINDFGQSYNENEF